MTTDELRATARAAAARAEQLARAAEFRHLDPPRLAVELRRASAQLHSLADAIDRCAADGTRPGPLWHTARAFQAAARARLTTPNERTIR